MRVWARKLEFSQGRLHIAPALYSDILHNVEDAFNLDFNMIVEEADFYYLLPPKLQSDLINFLFFDFKKQFSSFFDPCEQGFANELIVSLFARNLPANHCIASPGRKMEAIYFISEGFVAVTGPRALQPFLLLPPSSYLGDYQILFNLKSSYSFKVYIPPPTEHLTADMIRESGTIPPLQAQDELRVSRLFMCVKADTLLRLATLYPRTMEDLKVRALERREFFLTTFAKSETRRKRKALGPKFEQAHSLNASAEPAMLY